ncbi:MAG TPA: DUF732 domain-containing protein, partial [Acidimicrobiaceae bacterium]|nr:DUF732 domain-containing protein [Acidimicrobiaceae bacterium]
CTDPVSVPCGEGAGGVAAGGADGGGGAGVGGGGGGVTWVTTAGTTGVGVDTPWLPPPGAGA